MNTDRAAQAYIIVITTIVMVVLFWIVLSYWSLADRARAQRFTASITEIGRKIFLNRLRPRMSRQNTYTDKDISQFHWTNGLPPTDDESPSGSPPATTSGRDTPSPSATIPTAPRKPSPSTICGSCRRPRMSPSTRACRAGQLPPGGQGCGYVMFCVMTLCTP